MLSIILTVSLGLAFLGIILFCVWHYQTYHTAFLQVRKNAQTHSTDNKQLSPELKRLQEKFGWNAYSDIPYPPYYSYKVRQDGFFTVAQADPDAALLPTDARMVLIQKPMLSIGPFWTVQFARNAETGVIANCGSNDVIRVLGDRSLYSVMRKTTGEQWTMASAVFPILALSEEEINTHKEFFNVQCRLSPVLFNPITNLGPHKTLCTLNMTLSQPFEIAYFPELDTFTYSFANFGTKLIFHTLIADHHINNSIPSPEKDTTSSIHVPILNSNAIVHWNQLEHPWDAGFDDPLDYRSQMVSPWSTRVLAHDDMSKQPVNIYLPVGVPPKMNTTVSGGLFSQWRMLTATKIKDLSSDTPSKPLLRLRYGFQLHNLLSPPEHSFSTFHLYQDGSIGLEKFNVLLAHNEGWDIKIRATQTMQERTEISTLLPSTHLFQRKPTTTATLGDDESNDVGRLSVYQSHRVIVLSALHHVPEAMYPFSTDHRHRMRLDDPTHVYPPLSWVKVVSAPPAALVKFIPLLRQNIPDYLVHLADNQAVLFGYLVLTFPQVTSATPYHLQSAVWAYNPVTHEEGFYYRGVGTILACELLPPSTIAS